MRQRNKKKNKGKIQLDQIDIREVLDDLDIYYTESGKNVSDGWIGVACPFCGDDSNHMGINLNGKSISCFKCGTTGTVIKYLAEVIGSYGKSIEILGNSVPREMKRFVKSEQERSVHVELPPEASKKIKKQHAEYLISRGYSYKLLTKKYNFHFCGPESDYWSNRIIVPITKRGRLITFTSIDVTENPYIRYKHLPDEQSIISIKHYLYGLEHAKYSVCCLVEGLFDRYRIGDGALCSFGTNITTEQKLILTEFRKIIIAFDGDSTGIKAAEKIANDIRKLRGNI